MYKTLKPLVLASLSPRRRELLGSVGIKFRVEPGQEDDPDPRDGDPSSAAERQAARKAGHVSALFPDCWVLAADTIVILGGKIFGKPSNADEARRMLGSLSGQAHEVVSGMCLEHARTGVSRTGSVLTRVRFRTLSRDLIESYIHTGEPMDKAGAYGIQGAGAMLVRSLEGSYTSVVGLPLCETIEWLEEAGVIAPA